MLYIKSKSILSIALISLMFTSCNLKNELESKIESEIEQELENTLGTDSIIEKISKAKEDVEGIKDKLNKDSIHGEIDKVKEDLKKSAIKAKDSAISNAYNSLLDKIK